MVVMLFVNIITYKKNVTSQHNLNYEVVECAMKMRFGNALHVMVCEYHDLGRLYEIQGRKSTTQYS